MLKTVVDYWDGAYTVLEGDNASEGIPMWIRQPLGTGAFTLRSEMRVLDGATSALPTFENSLFSSPVLITSGGDLKEGRTDTLIDYWAGGAPGWHGASVEGKIAYRFQCSLRPADARKWWSSTPVPEWYLALGGNGYFRVEKYVAGILEVLYNGDITEADFLSGGLTLVGPINDMGPGDELSIYYVQDENFDWGGYVVKAVIRPDFTTDATLEETIRQAPAVGCDLFDTGTLPTKITLVNIGDIDITRKEGGAAVATIAVPLVNPQEFDGVGWEIVKTGSDNYLRMHAGSMQDEESVFTQDLGSYANIAAFLADGGSIVDPEGIVTWDLNTTHNLTGKALRAVLSGDTPSSYPYISTVYKTVTGLTPNTTYNYVVQAYNTASGFVNGIPIPRGRWYDFINTTVTSDSGGELQLIVGLWYISSGSPTDQTWFDGAEVTIPTEIFDIHRQRAIRIKTGFTDDFGNDELYTSFTGMIDDFGNVETNGIVPINCAGFEQRLLDQFIKNYPDRISYMYANYRKRRGTSQPVYDTTAYDAWPMELMLRDLMLRAGIPESITRQDLQLILADGSTRTVDYEDEPFKKFRARSMSGKLIRLDRPVHYGNNGDGFDPKKKPDDEYIFKPENTREIWNALRDVADRFGYELWFDEFGHCVLKTANNPSFVYDLGITDGSTQEVNPNAFAGTYQEWGSGDSPSFVFQASAARIDLILPRFEAAGQWTFTVVDDDSLTVSSGTLSPALPAGYADEFFYDFRTTIDGGNTTISTLFSGEFGNYTVTLTAAGSAAIRRIDSFLLWHTDPLMPRFTNLFSTDQNAPDIQAQGTMDEMRNYVLVVGRRKAIITDSTKLDTNPSNPTFEFIVQAAVDVESIIDPTATNFIGYQKQTIIYDTRITDSDYAAYLANSFIFKYRMPKPAATITHTIVPLLRMHEPVYAVEQKFVTITADQALWVTGFTHQIRYGQATTTINTTAYIPTPSYEPREDIDIDANFGGNPVVDLLVVYRSLDNVVKTNVSLGSAADCNDAVDIVSFAIPVVGESLDLTGNPWPPIPGTLRLFPEAATSTATNSMEYSPLSPGSINGISFPIVGRVPINGSITSPRLDSFVRLISVQLRVETPATLIGPATFDTITLDTIRPVVTAYNYIGKWYYEYHEETQKIIAYRVNGTATGLGQQGASPVNGYLFTLIIVWEAENGSNDPSKAVINTPYHHFFNVDFRDASPTVDLIWKHGDNGVDYARNVNINNYTVQYRKLWPGASVDDPYTGESPFYDPYTSELGYLVSFNWSSLISGLHRISIRSVFTDEVVAWLTEPDADQEDEESHWQFYTAGANKQLLWDGVDNVGQWNKRQSLLWAVYSQSSFEQDELPVVGKGFYVWNQEEDGNGLLGKLALISGQRDADNGKPIFGHGTYGCWYIKFEVQNDTLGDIPRVVKSTELDPAFNDGDESAIVYTHLSDPTELEIIEIADFDSTQVYDKTNPPTEDAGYWSTIPDQYGIIHNQKPIRIRYRLAPRPGVLWAGEDNKGSIKLFEKAQLRVSINDQLIVFDGIPYPGTDVPKRTVVNRRFVNDQHAVLFTGDQWLLGSQFKQATVDTTGREWVFLPEDFKKKFLQSEDEILQFMDYLQIEEVPFWAESRQIGGKHSRMQLAFMNYLFYLSTYTQDRSGRFSWAQNRKWLDRSKVIKNAYADWPSASDPDTPSTSITYKTLLPDDNHYQHRRTVIVRQWQDEPGWKAQQRSAYSFTPGDIGDQLLRHPWSAHDPAATTINGVAWASFGLNRDQYSQWHVDGRTQLPTQYGNINRQLGSSLGTSLGSWTWEAAPLWVPCVSRDFHPYLLVPPMVDMPPSDVQGAGASLVVTEGDFNRKFIYLTVDTRDYSEESKTGNDVAAADVWNSVVWDTTTAYDSSNTAPHVKFWPGTTVADNAGPAKGWMSPEGERGQQSNMLDYIRQDDTTHYEDLRGIFSRGSRPAEASKKVVPSSPYYINQYSYLGLTVEENIKRSSFANDQIVSGSPGYPKYRLKTFNYAAPSGFFQMKFRHQYYWESGLMFPTDDKGSERLIAMNHTKTRMSGPEVMNTIRFDDGAWTGWKDDVVSSGIDDTNHKIWQTKVDLTSPNVFETGFMPVAVGPTIRAGDGSLVTTEMLWSLVLVNERRESSI